MTTYGKEPLDAALLFTCISYTVRRISGRLVIFVLQTRLSETAFYRSGYNFSSLPCLSGYNIRGVSKPELCDTSLHVVPLHLSEVQDTYSPGAVKVNDRAYARIIRRLSATGGQRKLPPRLPKSWNKYNMSPG